MSKKQSQRQRKTDRDQNRDRNKRDRARDSVTKPGRPKTKEQVERQRRKKQ